MPLNLYDMTKQFEELHSAIEDGVITFEEAEETIEAMQMTIEAKAHNVTAFILNEESSVDGLKAAEAKIAKRRKIKQASIDRLKDYLLVNMAKSGIFEIECPSWKVKLAKCPPSVQLIEGAEELLDDKYMRTKITKTPNKTAIKEALTSGASIPGAALISKNRLKFL